MTGLEAVKLANSLISDWNQPGAELTAVCEYAVPHTLDSKVWVVTVNVHRNGKRAKIDGPGFVYLDERLGQLVPNPSLVAGETKPAGK